MLYIRCTPSHDQLRMLRIELTPLLACTNATQPRPSNCLLSAVVRPAAAGGQPPNMRLGEPLLYLPKIKHCLLLEPTLSRSPESHGKPDSHLWTDAGATVQDAG